MSGASSPVLAPTTAGAAPTSAPKTQQANLQNRRLWWAEGKRWVNLRVTTRALKTIQKKGLGPYAKSLGINLAKL